MYPRPRTKRLLLSIVAAGATVGPACSQPTLLGSMPLPTPEAGSGDGPNDSVTYPTEGGSENGCLNGSCSYPEAGEAGGPDVLNPSDGSPGEAAAGDVVTTPPDGHTD